MIITLIKSTQMFSLTLPQRVKGQYWLTDLDEKGRLRQLASIEAIDEKWFLKENKMVKIFDTEGNVLKNHILTPSSFLYLKIENSDERVILFAENIDYTRQTLTRIVAKEPAVFTIGRDPNNNFCFNNRFVSNEHARLMFDGEAWSICDLASKNGTYVNGYRIETKKLKPGDFIYIMGLKMVVGSNYIALNNPDEKLKIKSDSIGIGRTQVARNSDENIPEQPEKQFFSRSPRFRKEIEHAEVKIDPPPPLEKEETVPLALMIGPSITMGMTSVSTGLISLINGINGGNMASVIPTLLMSVSMLLGTVLWPLLTKRHEKKQRIANENRRQEKYLEYLSEIGEKFKRLSREQSDILNENLTSQGECADRVMMEKSNLWERVLGQADFLKLRLGIGTIEMDAEVKYPEKKFTMDDDILQNAMLTLAEEPKVLHNVPISLSLTENAAVGFYGEKAATYNFMKSVILQLVALHSYDELKIMILLDKSDEDEWAFTKYIPHFWSDDKRIRFFASDDDEVKEISAFMEKNILVRQDKYNRSYADFAPYYVLISASGKLSRKCETLSKLLSSKGNIGFSALFIGEKFNDFPKETKTVIHVNGRNTKLYDKDNTTGAQIVFDAEHADESIFGRVSEKLANIELDVNGQQYTMPSRITFLEMFNVGKVEYLNSLTRWRENNPTKTLQTPVGVNSEGELFNLDLHEKYHGPHGLVAGMTGSGKSEFIITYILSMAVNYHPDEVSFILIDYKGGGLAGAFENADRCIKLPHLAGTITNLDGASIKRSLISIQSELRRRQSIFNDALRITNEGTMDIYKYQQLYRDKVVTEPLPHLFIISDEFAELKTQQPDFMDQLISAARIGRSLGIHLILATQKPSGVVDDQIWSNSKFRVCLKVQERADSQDMIKCPDAAELTQTGRFYLQVGYNELFALGQSAWCGADYIPTDVIEKTVDTSIQVIDNIGRVVMNVMPSQKKKIGKASTKQIVSVVKYLSDLAKEENVYARPLWLEPIPERIYIDSLESKYGTLSHGVYLEPIVGEYDDPFNQKQGLLTVPLSREGNCLIYGSAGNGKATFLTTLCYSLIKNHTAEELNMYILDFGSETLKVFETAPQVGGFMTSADEEMITNLFKMLQAEMNERRSLFSDYGGDYASYYRNSGTVIPNIVVVLNDFSGFAEQYEDFQDDFTVLSRDGVKYGIYFAVSATGTNAIRYRTQQNFRVVMTLQLNDATDYSIIVGKTDGLIPSAYKGRGLVAMDRVYEFQTAYAMDSANLRETIIEFCDGLAKNSDSFAKSVPILPDTVDCDFVGDYIRDISRVPVGVEKSSLNISFVNLTNKVVLPVVAQELPEMINFAEELSVLLSEIANTTVIDPEEFIYKEELSVVNMDFDEVVKDVFAEMVERHNSYKDGRMEKEVLAGFDDRIYVILGYKRFYEKLSADSKDKLNVLLEKAEEIYKIHFVIFDTASQLMSQNYNTWYKKHISGSDGIWVGDGFADQYTIKISKITADLYDDIGSEYGYVVSKNRPVLVKLLSSAERE